MKILYVYPKSDELISRHVALLTTGLRENAEVRIADNQASFRQALKEMEPDIVHCHGCWEYFLARACSSARKNDVRIVVTPHGQLEPWVTKQQSLQENLSKTLLWQRRTIEKAYAVILLGKLEATNFKELGWNPRTEVIHNAVITNTITPAEMCSQTLAVYQKVMDSNTIAQMDDDSIHALAIIIKAGIMGDRRWIHGISIPEHIDWRRLLIYARHENISNYVEYGINILGLTTPHIDTSQIAAYFPDRYTTPRPLKEAVGNYEGDETNYLVHIIRHINKEPLLLHLIELTRELYRDTVNDDKLCAKLEDMKLLSQAARLMQILSEQTMLDEGFMPMPPLNDRLTKHFRRLLANHLKI